MDRGLDRNRASEIGLITDDVLTLAAELGRTFGIPQYREGSEAFTAMGDEHGLLLVMRRGRLLGFTEGSPADIFPTSVAIRAHRSATWQGSPLPYRVAGRDEPSA